jgi:hypothetical protein
MRYKVSNFDGSITFHEGDDKKAVMSAVDAHFLFYPLMYESVPDAPIWFVLWDYQNPIDRWFYGDEPEQDTPDDITRKIYKYRDENEIYYGD